MAVLWLMLCTAFRKEKVCWPPSMRSHKVWYFWVKAASPSSRLLFFFRPRVDQRTWPPSSPKPTSAFLNFPWRYSNKTSLPVSNNHRLASETTTRRRATSFKKKNTAVFRPFWSVRSDGKMPEERQNPPRLTRGRLTAHEREPGLGTHHWLTTSSTLYNTGTTLPG